MWLGNDGDLGWGRPRMAWNVWEALLAHWLRLSVGVCSVRRLQQFLEGRNGFVVLVFGMVPTCQGSGPMCYAPPPPPPAVYPA